MNYKLKKRWLIITLMLTATLATAAWIGRDEEKSENSSVRTERAPQSAQDEITIDQLKRSSASPRQDIFSGKSWYVPPPPPKQDPNPVVMAPPLPYVYMGKLQEPSGNIIIYLVRGDHAYIVREGEILDDVYRVEKIQPGQIIFTYIPMAVTQTLQFGADG